MGMRRREVLKGFTIEARGALLPDGAWSMFAQIEPPDVLALALKPSDDDDAWMARLFGASGQQRNVKLNWCTPAPHRVWLSDLSEQPLDQEVTLAAWDAVTSRAGRA
jgi:Glycosyl hydrolases family 38 C-terminal beta sandwich domain